MRSVWIENVEKISYSPLLENKSTDVLIIGGGMSGILCAHMLKSAGVDFILVEADEICSGITKNTTAKITFCHGLIYDKFIKKFGYDYAKNYLKAQLSACEKYKELCQQINCDYEQKTSYVYSKNQRKAIENEVDALNLLGIKASFSDTKHLPFETAGAVRVEGQAQFNPLKFLYALSKGLPIYEQTKVLELKEGSAVTQYGEIKYKKAIVATHFPILNKHGGYFMKMYQHRSYVIALEGAEDVGGIYVDECDKGMSFRNYKNLLLLGGGGHRTGKKGGNWKELENFAGKYYPNARIVNKWATQDCMTLDGVPYIGRYSRGTPNLFVATGFNKWGVTSSMVAANILCDLVRGKSNSYSEVFFPSRSIFHPQLAANAFESIVNLLTPTTPRCPHLGCALKYNSAEHSWDCPCHGSRFTEDGELIDNPATDDKRI